MENLPEEILIEIFDHLKFNDLRNLTETCVNFNEIINKTATLIDKFRFRCEKDSPEVGLTGIRKYRRARIWTYNQNARNILHQIAETIREIYLSFIDITSNDFRNILNSCSKLKQLRLSGINIKPSKEDFKEPLPQLELDSLSIFYCDDKIWKLFYNCQVKKLKIDESRQEKDFKVMKHFLVRQKQLEHLWFYNFRTFIFIFDDELLVDVEFRLKTLQFREHGNISANCDFHPKKNLKQFLKNQKSLYRISSLAKCSIHNHDVLAAICCDVPHIKKLEIETFGYCVSSLPSIDTLVLIRYVSLFNSYHKIFPNVKNLTLARSDSFKFVETIVEITENLEEIPYGTTCKFDHFKIPNLNELTLCSINFGESDDPFEYYTSDIQIEKLTILKCQNIDWLFKLIKSERTKFKSLAVIDTEMKKSDNDFLMSLNSRNADENIRIDEMKICVPMKRDEKTGELVHFFLDEDVVEEPLNLRQSERLNIKRQKLE